MKTPSPLEAAAARKPGVVTLHLPAETLRGLGAKIPDGVNVLVCPPESLHPEFIRLPKLGGVCSVTGLPRSTLVDLLKRAGTSIKVRSLRRPGALSGPVLIERRSLIDFINSQPSPDWSSEEHDEEESTCQA